MKTILTAMMIALVLSIGAIVMTPASAAVKCAEPTDARFSCLFSDGHLVIEKLQPSKDISVEETPDKIIVSLSGSEQTEQMIVPDVGIKQGGGVGIEEPMIAPEPQGPKQAPLPLPGGKPIPQLPEDPIVVEANKSAEQVITAVETNVMNTQTVEEVKETVETVVDEVEGNVNGTTTPEETTEAVDEVVEVVEETPEVQVEEVEGGLIALLTELVKANQVNPNLTEDEKNIQEQYLENAKEQLSSAFT